jgi:hypothetical protein
MEIITYAIANGFKAPTYNHLRDWDFIILKNLESKLKLIESENLEKPIAHDELEHQFANEETVMRAMYLDAIPKQKRMILEAPVVVIVVFKPKTPIEEARRVYDVNCIASVWTCIENFLLSLAEQDVFGVTYIPQNTKGLKNRFGIPAGLEIASVIPIGYRSEDAKTLTQKPIRIADRIHSEKW